MDRQIDRSIDECMKGCIDPGRQMEWLDGYMD